MSKAKIDKKKDLPGIFLGNNIYINPKDDYTQLITPKQTDFSRQCYTSFGGSFVTAGGNTATHFQFPRIVDGGYAISTLSRPILEIFGQLDLEGIVDGSIESRIWRESKLSPIAAAKLYLQLAQLNRMAIKTFVDKQSEAGLPDVVETMDIPAFMNKEAIDDLSKESEAVFIDIDRDGDLEQSIWKSIKQSIRGFLAGVRTKAVAKAEKKEAKISKSTQEIFKQLRWIITGWDNKPLSKTAQMLISYAQDVLVPHKLGTIIFDNHTLNTNFFSIGQTWRYMDAEGNINYVPLTLNNLDVGYLPHNLEIRMLFDALKNVGPRLVNIQATYSLLSSAIFDYIHKQAKVEQGDNYSKVVTNNQIRITINSLLAGFYNDICNDFEEPGAKDITLEAQEEIKEWILGFLEV